MTLLNPVNAQSTKIKQKTTVLAMSGATETWSNAIPAGTIVFGLTARVTTEITGCTTFDVGDADTDLYIDGMAVAAGTTGDLANSNATLTAPKIYRSVTDLTVTAVGGAANFSAGALRLTIHYIDLVAATS